MYHRVQDLHIISRPKYTVTLVIMVLYSGTCWVSQYWFLNEPGKSGSVRSSADLFMHFCGSEPIQYCSSVVVVCSRTPDQQTPPRTGSPAFLHQPVHLSVLRLLTGPVIHRRAGGGRRGGRDEWGLEGDVQRRQTRLGRLQQARVDRIARR